MNKHWQTTPTSSTLALKRSKLKQLEMKRKLCENPHRYAALAHRLCKHYAEKKNCDETKRFGTFIDKSKL